MSETFINNEPKFEQKVASDFLEYLRTGNETKINSYTKVDLNRAIAFYQDHTNQPYYQEIVNRRNYLERQQEEKQKDKWHQRPLFVTIIGAVITGIFSLAAYFFGVQTTVNNVPIQSNNRQYGNIYAQQIIFNENGTFKINGTALDQSTGAKVNFTAVSQDVAVVQKNSK